MVALTFRTAADRPRAMQQMKQLRGTRRRRFCTGSFCTGWFCGPVVVVWLCMVAVPVRAGSPAAAADRLPAVAFLTTPRSGTLLPVGVGGFAGVGNTHAWQTPLSGYGGDRWQLLRLGVFYHPGRRVLLSVRGGLDQRLVREKREGPPRVHLSGDSLHDVEDFEINAVLWLRTAAHGRLDLALRIGMRLPNTNQHQGMGTNTSDLFFSLNLSGGPARFRYFLDAGVGILSAPLETNNQNDVALYGIGLLWGVGHRLWLGGEVHGYFTTRHVVPAGTESRGVARVGGYWQVGAVGVELYVQHGLTHRSGRLGSGLLISWWVPR